MHICISKIHIGSKSIHIKWYILEPFYHPSDIFCSIFFFFWECAVLLVRGFNVIANLWFHLSTAYLEYFWVVFSPNQPCNSIMFFVKTTHFWLNFSTEYFVLHLLFIPNNSSLVSSIHRRFAMFWCFFPPNNLLVSYYFIYRSFVIQRTDEHVPAKDKCNPGH